MKKSRRILGLLLSVILLSATLTAIPAYAQEQSGEVKMERTIQKSLSAAEEKMQRMDAQPITSVSTYAELAAAIQAKTANIYILKDIQLEEALQIDYNVAFLAANTGITLFSAKGFRHIQITASDVQIQFDNVTLDGGYESGAKTCGGIEATGVSNISLISPIIQNCCNRTNGSAIYNDADTAFGTFSIYNGVIKNNKIQSGSAVKIYTNKVVIYNTRIESNIGSTNHGFGGLSISTFDGDDYELNGSAFIYNSTICNNTGRYGGGIFVEYTDLIINDQTIIDSNKAKTGGGIHAEYATIESCARITNNSAVEHGGGVDLNNSTFILQEGEISYNAAGMTPTNAKHYGGGISISNINTENQDNIIINGGIIQGNISIIGGGIGYNLLDYFEKPNQPRVIMNGGTICNNGFTVEEDGSLSNICFEGGGIYGSYVELNDGIIEKNICYGSGAGVSAQTDFIMRDGTIQDNGFYENEDGNISVQTNSGGGIYIYQNGTITGGLIYGNQANHGGGICVFGNLSLSAPAYVRFNNATDVGGGIYFFKESGAADTDLSRIRNNTAENGSDQYCFRQ